MTIPTKLSTNTPNDGSQFQFRMDSTPFKFSEDGDGPKRKRQFSGVAYSGGVISNHWYWGNVIFDLNSMSVPAKLPALIDHDRGKRAGFATQHSIDNAGLSVMGTLMSNECGTAVATESDEGFPWQMSVHIEPGSIEELKAGTNATVNGREHQGPLTIFRNSRINEVSFTATGWDANTTAAAMSRGVQQSSHEGIDMNELEQLKAEVAKLTATNGDLATKLTAATDQLGNYSKQARLDKVKSLFSHVNREFKADAPDVLAFAAMTDEAFTAVDGVMRATAPAGTQAPTQTTQQAAPPAQMFSHVANLPTGTQTQAPAADPLVADAKRRAEEFSKRAA